MTAAVLLGAAAGVGLWLALTAARPVPLATALAHLFEPPQAPPTSDPPGRVGRWLLRLVAVAGARTPEHDQQLALAGRTPETWARDKVLAALAGLGLPLAGGGALATVGVRIAPAIGVVAVAGAAGGWLLVDVRLRETVTRRRKDFQYALSAYLDLVNIILAGGGGIQTALVAAADAGDGWAFAELRHALHRAERINQPLWTAFDELGTQLGVAELRDLASSIGLAGAQGARIRASLAVKADTLRARQISQTEATAEATTERMNLPTALLLAGFLLFIVFPAVTAITQTASAGCPPDAPASPECPAEIIIDPERSLP